MFPGSATDPAPLKALLTTAVWGKDYIDRFLNYSLRTQLSSGNLGALSPESVFLIITDAADVDYVTASPAYRALSAIVRTECLAREEIAGSRSGDKYAKLTACQNHALWNSGEFDAIFFGYGDALWADGTYLAAARRLQEGYDAVFGFGYPVVADRFVSSTPIFEGDTPALPASIPPRTFSQQVYAHLHPMAHANNWNNAHMGPCSSYLMWNVPDQGLLLRSFHLHPIAVRVFRDSSDFFAPFRSTLDEEFVARLYRLHPKVYVCTDSDEMGVCSLAVESHKGPDEQYALRPPRVGVLAEFAEGHAGLLHRELFRHSIRLTIDDVDGEKWCAVEEQAERIAEEIEKRLAIPDGILALEHPTAYRARMWRQAALNHMSPFSMELFNRVAEVDRSRSSVFGRAMQSVGRGIVMALHATGISRSFRLHLLPRLGWRQRLWIHELLKSLGINAPLIKARTERDNRWGWWRWLLSWMRIHPEKKRPYTTS